MSESQVIARPRSRWRVLGPLTALVVIFALLALLLLFFEIIGWAFSRRGTPAEDFWQVTGLLLLGIVPAVVMLVLSLQRRPAPSIGGAVLAGLVLLVVAALFAQPVAETSLRYADRLHDESLPLLPEETAFTVAEATAAAEAERDATIEFLGIEPEYRFEQTLNCQLSTGIPGVIPYATADIHLSDWPKETVDTVPELLRQHWEDLGYDASVHALSDDRLAVDFVSHTDPVLAGRALWEPTSLRFKLRVDGPCLQA